MSRATLHCGDVRTVLSTLPAESVQCVVTSPPYWGLRDYGTAKWEGGDTECDHKNGPLASARSTLMGYTGPNVKLATGGMPYRDICGKCQAVRVDQQLGLEGTPGEYVEAMVSVFRAVRRVLRADGCVWLNLGDSYNGYMANQRATSISAANQHARPVFESGHGRRTVDLKPKDLVGIPWMVAKALQAPEYMGRIANEVDRAWLAGITDGEGCITILETTSPHGSGNSFPPVLQIRMCDLGPMEKVAQVTGLGKPSPKQEPPSHGGNHGSYSWRLNGRTAVSVIAEIYPYLIGKRKQAIVAWNHQAIRDSYQTKRGVHIPEAAVEKQRYCRDLIRRLNKREAVDLPPWMEEPSTPVQPGWYLRSDCIWAKPNPMPESVTDRPTRSHEYLFLLTKSERYFYDAQAIAEPVTDEEYRTVGKIRPTQEGGVGFEIRGGLHAQHGGRSTRNARSVWTIPTMPYPAAHFATFPEELARRCILAGSSPRACEHCGAPWERQVERTPAEVLSTGGTYSVGSGKHKPQRGERSMLVGAKAETTGWQPTCSCENTGTGRSVVLDPFGGSGTVAQVATGNGRDSVYIDLNPAYRELARQRIGPMLCEDAA